MDLFLKQNRYSNSATSSTGSNKSSKNRKFKESDFYENSNIVRIFSFF
jgi:hypothetical protein